MTKLLSILIIASTMAFAQSRPDATNRTFTGAVDASGATRTAPAKAGTAVPGTCTIGEVFFETDATAGKNFWYCTATNTYTQQLAPPIEKRYFTAAGCSNTTATAAWDLPTANAATATCIGTTTTTGLLTFADGSTQVATVHHRFPSDWTSANFGVTLIYSGSASSTSTIDWRVSTACVADTEDLTSPSYNTATTNSAAGPTTTPQQKSSSFSPAVTNCAAGETVYIKVEKVTGDSYAGSGYILGMEVAYTRAQ